MGKTSIEWTDHSINPVRARTFPIGEMPVVGHYCEKVSSGCALCYASRLQSRFQMPPFPGHGKGLTFESAAPNRLRDGEAGFEVFFDESKLHEVLKRKKPTRWFWCDMTDLFGRWVPDAWIDQCFATMALTPWHTHQVLTKRPERMAAYLSLPIGAETFDPSNEENTPVSMTRGQWLGMGLRSARWADFWGTREQYNRQTNLGCQMQFHGDKWPLPNVWLGTSCENQAAADERIPHLLRCPAAVRFLSCEPLLGEIDLQDHLEAQTGKCSGNPSSGDCDCRNPNLCSNWELDPSPIHWVIVGGESGSGARPMHLSWASNLVEQCKAAGVPIFVKQLGKSPIGNDPDGDCPWPVSDGHGTNVDEWPEILRVREFPEVVR